MIAVVVLTYRADPAVFDVCLASVLAAGGADRVVVVDNGQTVDRARLDAIAAAAGSDGRGVELLTTEENLGFAGGMNAGLSHVLAAGATAVAILNDDTVVETGWLEALAGRLEGDGVGAVQPKLLLAEPDRSGPPRLYSVGMSVRADGAGVDIGFGDTDAGDRTAGPIDLFTGAALLLDARFLTEVGGFDERYFMYYEDIDLARRGREAGWRYLIEPAAVVHHAWSATARAQPGLHRYWQERNRLWWLFRHGTVWNVVRGLLLSFGRLAKHPGRPQLSAIKDGLAGARRCRQERRVGRVVVAPLPRPAPVPWSVR